MSRCDACHFWEKSRLQPETRTDPDEHIGTCRRHAPRPSLGDWEHEVLRHLTIISWMWADDEQRESDYGMWEEAELWQCSWPATIAQDWCGEWKERTIG